jgi:signal transduction histidine kinase
MRSPAIKQLLANSARAMPLRLLLIVPFLLQIFAAVGVVGYLSFKNGQQAVDELAHQLALKASYQVSDHLDLHMAFPKQLNQLNAVAIAAGEIDLNDQRRSEQYFWRQIKTFRDLNYIGYTLTDGREAGAARWYGDAGLILYENQGGKGKAFEYLADEQGNRAQLVQNHDYNPLTETWYQQTVKAGIPIWSNVYAAVVSNVKISETGRMLRAKSSVDPETYVTVSAKFPFYDKTRKLLGVLSVDLLLTDINQFLRDLGVSPSGQVFLLERDGLLVASSGGAPVWRKVNQVPKRFHALESPDPLIRAVAQKIKAQFGSFQAIRTDQHLVMTVSQERQFVEVSPWRDGYGLDWLIVVTVPESDFMARTNANTHLTIFLCLGALGVSVLVGVYTAQWIAQPILRLSQISGAIATGRLDQQVESSHVKELNILADSFNKMTRQVRESFTALAEANAQLEDRVEERTNTLKATLQELRQTQAQMIQAEKMSSLGQLVAGIAHEINNPINFIHGNVLYVEEYSHHLLELIHLYQQCYPNPDPVIATKVVDIDLEFINEDLLKLLTSMHVGTERIQEIVKSLRMFSRLDEAEVKEVDIHEGLESTLLILHYRLKAKPGHPAIKVIRDYGQLPLVECYSGQLNQVFMNILTNAIDALEDDKTQLSSSIRQANTRQITIRTSSLSPDWVQIAIADNGPGIPEAVRHQIFDPFFTTKPVGKGTGLGMSISYQIVTNKHQGKLTCISQVGKGTEFVIQIPVRQQSRSSDV